MRIHIDNSWIETQQTGPEQAQNLLMVTGFIGHSAFWLPVVRHLERDFRVTTYDQRGTGDSGPYSKTLSMQQMTNDALCILESVISEPTHIIGHSAGAGVCLMLAAQHPRLVKSISLLGGWTKADAWMHRVFSSRLNALKESGPLSYTALTTLFMNPPSIVSRDNLNISHNEEHYSRTMPDYGEILDRANAVLEFNSYEWAADVTCPTLVIGANDDAMTPLYFSEELASSITQAVIHKVDSGGHYFPRNETDKTASKLLEFLNNHQ